MAQCVRCGREIPAGEIFCESCANKPLPDSGNSSAPRHLAGKNKKKTASRPASRKGLIAALCICIVLVIAAAVGCVYLYSSVAQQRAALRAQEADVAKREQQMEKTEAELQTRLNELALALDTIEKMEAEITALKEQIHGSESESSQNQYDLTAAQARIEELEAKQVEYETVLSELTDELTTLQANYDGLFADHETLTADHAFLSDMYDAVQEKMSWIDAYVVYVENDGTEYYHTFDCEKFVRKSFWVYNRKLAENKGYSACPICGG